MSERYTRLFSLPENLGQDGCPVLISAGALLKDNNTGNLLVQLKLRNISEQVIKSVKIKVNAYDTAGSSLRGVEDFSYLDLAVERDGEFGSKTPIVLPDKTTRSISVEILSVVCGNGQIYQSSNSVVAGFVDDETIQKIELLNNERQTREIAIQQEKKQKALKYVAFLPLVMYVFAIISGYNLYYWTIGSFGRYWCRILFSLIVPCMCLLSSRAKHNQINFFKITLGISIAFVFVQFVANLYYYNYNLYDRIHELSTMLQYECLFFIDKRIGGCHLLFVLKNHMGLDFANQELRRIVFSDIFFLSKNISAIIITILQLKVIKKQLAERKEQCGI